MIRAGGLTPVPVDPGNRLDRTAPKVNAYGWRFRLGTLLTTALNSRFIIGTAFLLFIGAWALGETYTLGSLPTRPSTGYKMWVEIEAVSGNGYQPIRLDFRPSGKAFVRDRHIEVGLSPRQHPNGNFLFTFRQAITIPEGSATYSKTIHVPHYYNASEFQVELLEDGRPVRWGTAKFGLGNDLRHRFAGQRVTVGIIQPRDAPIQDAAWKVYPDVRTLVTVLGDGPIPQQVDSTGISGPVASRLNHQQSEDLAKGVQPAWVQFRPIIEDQLPENWLGYSQLDVILVPSPVVERIAVEQPSQMQALESWLAAGGNLWVNACDAIDGPWMKRLDMKPVGPHQVVPAPLAQTHLNLTEKNDTSPIVSDYWNGPTKQSQHHAYNHTTESLSLRSDVYAKLEQADHPFAETASDAAIAATIQRAGFGLGEVIAIRTEDPFPGSYQFWKTIADLPGPEKLNWISRNGIDVPSGDESYWSWLIGSVGQPPVKSFVILNLLFAILVGPICYFFLLRRNRLYLLYFVAPTLAFLVTCSLFTYALMSDGISTKQRTRQITWLDGKHGYNIAQSRSTYYRVLGFGQQIDVAGDTAIYPVRHAPMGFNYYSGQRNEERLHGVLRTTGDRQLFSNGFLPTRNQVQYLTIQPRVSEPAITVDWNAKIVSSCLPQAVRQILVSDQQGKYWEAFDLESRGTAPLQPCLKVSDQLRGMLGNTVLPDQRKNPIISTYSWSGNNVSAQTGLLENRLQQWSQHLPNSSFIGIAQLDEDRLGISDAIMLDSTHVIMGELP